MQSYSLQTFIKNRFTNLLEIMTVPVKSQIWVHTQFHSDFLAQSPLVAESSGM